MFDCHYDLLTHILMKKEDVNFLKDYCSKVYNSSNITGGIFNLFYMSPKEMKDEINIENMNVIKDLEFVKKYIEKNKLISSNINYIFGIEGLDFLEKIEDIDKLYSLGLRSTNIVWNNTNKFGGGAKGKKEEGLTKLGEELVAKLVSKHIAIDLSHSNEKTFWNIIDVCRKLKQNGQKPIVFASHSNAKALCNVPRNLIDEQILAIKELDGVIGVVSIKNFCLNVKELTNPNIDYRQAYISHINYIKDLLGGVDNISVSTDDMKYYYIDPEYYQNLNVYEHNLANGKIKVDLQRNGYSKIEIDKILEENFKNKILKRL